MNQQQRTYALGRVATILKGKEEVLKAAFVIPAETLSDKERWALVKAGMVNLEEEYPFSKCSSYDNWKHAWDFTPYEKPETFAEGYEEALKELRADAENIKDRIMLGDAEEALALLDKFLDGPEGEAP